MTKTLAQVGSSDTFQVWLQRTNDIISELGSSVVTASALGDITQGSVIISGSFTSNTASVQDVFRTNIIDTKVGNTSPISIRGLVDVTSSEQLPFTLTNSVGPRVRVKNNNIAWHAGLRGSAGTGTNAEYIITIEGSNSPTFRFGTNGVFYANSIALTSESSSATGVVRADRTIDTNNGITGGGDLTADRTFSLTGNALALHNLTTNGFVVRTGTGAISARSLAEGDGINIVNGSGVSGNPSIAVDTSVVRTSGTQTIGGSKTFSSALMIGTAVASQIYFSGTQINASPNNTTTDSMSINYTTRDNAYYRNLNIYDGRSGLIGKFEGSTSSYIAGSGTQYQTQLLGNQINGSPYYNGNVQLALNYSTYTNTFRDFVVYDGKQAPIAIFTGASGNFSTYGNITAYGDIRTSSDSRLKTNVITVDNALSKVLNMRGVYFERKGEKSVGVIAQEMEQILPEVVSNSEEYKTVAYGNIVGVLIEAIKELKQEIEELKQK